jgi:hypothetical protein
VFVLATHGLSYTPGQVRAMTARDRDALLAEAKSRATEASREAAMAESRAKALAGAKPPGRS